jgi:hypothetical protein
VVRGSWFVVYPGIFLDKRQRSDRQPATGNRQPATIRPATGNRQPATGNDPTGNRQPATGNDPTAASNWLESLRNFERFNIIFSGKIQRGPHVELSLALARFHSNSYQLNKNGLILFRKEPPFV